MKASYMTDIRKVEMREIPMPAVQENEVLVKLMHCGVCGSDIHFYEHGRIGSCVVTPPMILGHECAGEIVQVGSMVRHLQVGDRVALEPGRACGTCEYCKSGRYNLCPDMTFMATPPVDGAFREYISYPADYCFKLPDNMDTIEGALLEPLNVGFHAAMRAEPKVGQSAVILGSGCIGLCVLMALHTMGVQEIYMFDMIDRRLEKARELGAAGVYNSKEVDPRQIIQEKTGGAGVDLVFETAGAVATTKLTAYLVKAGGTIVMIGEGGNALVEYPFSEISPKEVDLRTIRRYRNLYPTVIKAVSTCGIPLKKLVTDTFCFDEIDQALEYSVVHKADTVKTVIEF